MSNSEFQQRLTACAVSRSISIEADIIGSITDLYDGHRVQGTAELRNESNFLKNFPEPQKLLAYELYLKCIKSLISHATDFRQGCMDGSISACSKMLDQLRLVSNYCDSFSTEFKLYENKFDRLRELYSSLETSWHRSIQDAYDDLKAEISRDHAKFGKRYSACRDAEKTMAQVSALIYKTEKLCEAGSSGQNDQCSDFKQELASFLGQVRRLTQESGYASEQ